MAETVDDLKAKIEELVERRVELAYQLAGAHHHECLEKLATVQSAIVALEAVIASGAEEPAPSSPDLSVWG